jgi:hypothetical protein
MSELETPMNENEIVDLFNEISATEASRAPKGEKSTQIRNDVRAIIKIVKKDEISLATLRKMVLKMMRIRATKAGMSEDDAKENVNLEQSQFNGIITKTWKTETKDGFIIVYTNEELPAKVHEPKKAKKGKASDDSVTSDEDLGDLK